MREDSGIDQELIDAVGNRIEDYSSHLIAFSQVVALVLSLILLMFTAASVALLFEDLSTALQFVKLMLAFDVLLFFIFIYYLYRIVIFLYSWLGSFLTTGDSEVLRGRYVYENEDFEEVHGVEKSNAVAFMRLLGSLSILVLWIVTLYFQSNFKIFDYPIDVASWVIDRPSIQDSLIAMSTIHPWITQTSINQLNNEIILLLAILFPAFFGMVTLISNLHGILKRQKLKRYRSQPSRLRSELIGFSYMGWGLLGEFKDGKLSSEFKSGCLAVLASALMAITGGLTIAILIALLSK